MARERVGAESARFPVCPATTEQRPPPTAATLVSGEPANTPAPCCYCGQPHYPTDCDTITTIDARKQLLCRNGRCFSCLRRGHLSRDCRSASRCRGCRGRHHTSICESSSTSKPINRGSSQSHTPNSGSSTVAPNPTLTPPVSTSSTLSITTHSALNPSAPSFTPPSSSTSLRHFLPMLTKSFSSKLPSLM